MHIESRIVQTFIGLMPIRFIPIHSNHTDHFDYYLYYSTIKSSKFEKVTYPRKPRRLHWVDNCSNPASLISGFLLPWRSKWFQEKIKWCYWDIDQLVLTASMFYTSTCKCLVKSGCCGSKGTESLQLSPHCIRNYLFSSLNFLWLPPTVKT